MTSKNKDCKVDGGKRKDSVYTIELVDNYKLSPFRLMKYINFVEKSTTPKFDQI